MAEQSKQIPQYRAYCDICNSGSGWFEMLPSDAEAWREMHFEGEHPDNPMVKQNCRIQKRTVHVDELPDEPDTEPEWVENLGGGND